ncbi:MAG TPA: LacI family DNA-binding transcriptional regulator [Prosthecobacter sp.]|nr:LacI family DNA-binding transcriptional regulator [Prosthecobacter sp.]
MPEESVSLQAVADHAGVSAMTVSRVLRGSPSVTAATRERVLAAVRAVGYRPDPHLARMMDLVRGRKNSRVRAVIAVVRECLPKDDLQAPAYQYVAIEDIRQRADRYGYQIEEFWLGRDGMTPKRLSDILDARGIEGVIVSPQSSRMLCGQLDYSRFAAVTFGYGLKEPSLHRSAGNMTVGIQMATAQLLARGYRRIGMAVTQWVDDRSQSTYSGAMLRVQEGLPKRQRVPMLLFPHNDLSRCAGVFYEWMRAHQPDALITFDSHVPGWLKKLGLQIPRDIGLVVHDWHRSMTSFAGIHQRRDHVAAAAVDLIATQLTQHERGVPEVPRQIMIPAQWIEGPSIRPAPSESHAGPAHR